VRARLVAELARGVRDGRGLAHKRDIAPVMARLGLAGTPVAGVRVGDDCAAIPDGDGWLLFAIESFLDDFTAAMPWFAGWCGVMVNLSDIAAMGGRAIAVVDALCARDGGHAAPMLDGLAAASRVYGVPLVGGHTNTREHAEHLSVAVLGRARRLLSSFAARPGEVLVAAIDLRGAFHDPHPFWDASTRGASPERLRGDLAVLPGLAEAGLCRAAKDISNAGLLGTALMLAECSGIGLSVSLDAIPRPEGVDLARWVAAFPSYGFLLAAREPELPAVLASFAARGIAAAAVGRCEAGTRLELVDGSEREVVWDLADSPLMGVAA